MGLDPLLLDKRPTLIDSAGQVALAVDASGMMQLSVLALAGATVTVSRVADIGSTTNLHAAGQFTVAAGTLKTIPIDWRYYYLSVAGGQAWVCLV